MDVGVVPAERSPGRRVAKDGDNTVRGYIVKKIRSCSSAGRKARKR